MAHVNVHKIKQDICEIGRRIYAKGFAAANDGNITVRIGENEILCTPTLHCKGFLKPEDICTIDMQGNQTAGIKKRSSEALLHLEIYRQRPEIKSVVHCHPPHACAFAIAREPIPQCILPEVEVFLGDVPITKYETPGGQAFADTVRPFVEKTNIIILANHGTVSYGQDVERAYWWTEILDAYCRMLLLARSLGRVNYFDEPKERELLELKAKWGYEDPRNTEEYKNCDICANDIFRDTWKESGVQRRAFEAPPAMRAQPITAKEATASAAALAVTSTNGSANQPTVSTTLGNIDQEALIQAITDRVMSALGKA